MTDNVVLLKPRPCPICGKPSVAAFQPFCSGRCADVDLNRWLNGAYAIPGKPVDEDDESDDQPPLQDDDSET